MSVHIETITSTIGDSSEVLRLGIFKNGEKHGELVFRNLVEAEWIGGDAHAMRAIVENMRDEIAPRLRAKGIGKVVAVVWSHRRGLHKFLQRLKFECWDRSKVNVLIMEVDKWL